MYNNQLGQNKEELNKLERDRDWRKGFYGEQKQFTKDSICLKPNKKICQIHFRCLSCCNVSTENKTQKDDNTTGGLVVRELKPLVY